jgi:putative intracellular protease/amidase
LIRFAAFSFRASLACRNLGSEEAFMRKLFIAITLLAAIPMVAEEHKPYTRNVAVVVYENAEPLDWTGPFEVYNDAASFGESNGQPAFNVYIVSKTTEPINAQGLKVVPNYSIANAPKPDIVIFPGGPSSKIYDDVEFFAWAKKASAEAEIAQSVCTGAFVLAKAGMLDNLEVTTFHGAIEALRKNYPNVRVQDGRRFVDNGHIVTTAGISAGIDGSLNVVARLLGRRVADDVATYMEYHWTPEAYLATKYAYLNPSTNDTGRLIQTGDMEFHAKNYAGAERIYRSVLKENPSNQEALFSLGMTLREADNHADAAQAFATAAVAGKDQHQAAHIFYMSATEYARADLRDEALDMLRKAFAAGYTDRDGVAKDPNFAKLKDDPRMKTIVAAR